jgi:hypothetical protein
VLEQSFTKLTAVKRTASSPGLDKCQYQPQIKRNLKNISVWWKICIGIFRVGEFLNWEISVAAQITKSNSLQNANKSTSHSDSCA